MYIKKIHTCTGHRAALYALARGADHRHFLTAGGDGWIVEWSLDQPETGQLVATVETQVFSLLHVVERQLILAGNMHGGLHWIHPFGAKSTRNILHHRHGVYDLLAVDDRLYSAGGDGLLTRWSIQTERAVESMQLSNQALRTIAYAPSLNELAIGASDGCIYLLDETTLQVRRIIETAHSPSVFTVAYSPDQQQLVSGGRDAQLKVWGSDGTNLLELPAHRFTLNHLAFSPDTLWLVTASRDKTYKVWDAHTYELLKVIDTVRFGNHINSINRLLWVDDTLVTASDDRSAMIWHIAH